MSTLDSVKVGGAQSASQMSPVMSLARSHRWTIAPSDKSIEDMFVRELGVTSLVARVLAARGIDSVADARLFLTPSLERDWCDPTIIPGLVEVADRVERALRSHETIAIFGDFDVDGITSTCLLTEGLRALGGNVYYFIPRRFDEGYGLSEIALQRVLSTCTPDLVITVDNGIAAKHEVCYLTDRGIDVCVTDHHEPLDLVPEDIPVADPKLASSSPSRELAGVGVALKLIQLLGSRFGQPDMWRRWTEVACLGTVSDMMLLTPENRALVAEGIAQMRTTSRPGFIALAAVSGTNLEEISADNLSFSLIPRLNAAGRMADPALALDLLLEQDPACALTKAQALEQINLERREIESDLTSQAISMVEQTYAGGRAIVIGGEGWHEGVKGIVASRLVNKYHVPALLFTIKDGIAHGSGRSVGSINLFEAVEKCSDLLIRFGGHSGAVGVTLEASNLSALRKRLEAQFDELDEDAFEDKGEVTAVVSLDELSIENVESLPCLEPFGQGNKAPIFAVEGVTMADRAVVGRTGEHLRFLATDGKSCIPAIMFRAPHIEQLSDCCNVCDIVFEAIAEKWQGRVKTKLMVKDIIPRCYTKDDCMPKSEFVENLFSMAEQACGCGEYVDFSAASRKNSHVRKVESLPANMVSVEGDSTPQTVEWQSYIPLPDDHSLNLDFLMQKGRFTCSICDNPAFSEAVRMRCELSCLDECELEQALVRAFIGENKLHEAQKTTLDLLHDHKNVLSVMATGRGKSLIFQIHAARLAVSQRKVSIFVFPLRALVFDQQFHMLSRLNEMGIHVEVLTGETPLDVRADIFNRIATGKTDIVLTTPEFLTIHSEKFALSGRIGFVVVDEAHHAGRAKSGQRLSYLKVPQTLNKLGNPQVLALTATADDDITSEICSLFSIDEVIVDQSCRSNLIMLDERGLSNREGRLVSIVASGDKTVVYVNSREQSISLARVLRKRVPELGNRIAFYNAGLSRQTRTRVETAFRDGELSCIVSTSAFGEGVNIPNIRHVVLYHMPFGAVEFNQMSGRAGRDGNPAYVHLLFSARDARINERILNAAAPSRDDLVVLYRALQTMWRRHIASLDEASGVAEHTCTQQPEGFVASNADIALVCRQINGACVLDERAVSCGIAIFRELGFARLEGFGTSRRITMLPATQHVDLNRSIRYLEGIRTRLEFSTFKEWALDAPVEDMLKRINRPITPHNVNVRLHTVDSQS